MEAERAEGDNDIWGFVWQGNAYEGPDLRRAGVGHVQWRRPDR
jgi:hypothetical protein